MLNRPWVLTLYAGIGRWWQNLFGPSISKRTNCYAMLEIFSSISACWWWKIHGILIWSIFWQNIWNIQYSNYTNSWYLYMYFYTSYGFLSVFEIDKDSLHNFNTYLLLSAKLQQMADLSVTNYWDKATPSSIITCAKFQSVIHACIHKWIKLCPEWFKSLWFYVQIY